MYFNFWEKTNILNENKWNKEEKRILWNNLKINLNTNSTNTFNFIKIGYKKILWKEMI